MKEPVLFWPVRLRGDVLHILDETRIPRTVTYLKVRDHREAVRAVKEMKTRAFGQFLTVCYSFMLEINKKKGASKEEQMACLRRVAEDFNKSRPTFPFAEVTSMVLGMAEKVYDSLFFADDFLAAMEGFLENGIRRQRLGRAQAAAQLIGSHATVLTHCHVSGEMALIGMFCRQQKKKVRFLATETRPYLQGARLTAWELAQAGLDVTLVPDSAVAKLMADGDVDCVIVGSDRSARNGDFANKIGTYQIALLARHFKVPFYALVQPSDRLASGKEIPVEIRDEEEVLAFEGRRLAPKGARAFYPGFDIVDHNLVTRLIAVHAR